MADDKDKVFGENKNYLQESQVEVGRDFQIGDNNSTTNIHLFDARTMVVLLIVGLAIFSVYFFLRKNQKVEAFSKAKIEQKRPIDLKETEDLKTEDLKKVKSERTPKKVAVKEKFVPHVKVSIVDTPDEYKNAVKAEILQQAKKYNLKLNQRNAAAKYNRELKCAIRVNEREVEIGIRNMLIVSFELEVTYLQLSNMEHLARTALISEEYKIYNRTEIPKILRSWMSEIETNIFPKEIL